MSAAPNGWALDRRLRKISDLTAALDLCFLAGHIDDPAVQLLMVESAGEPEWKQVASTASALAKRVVHPPSKNGQSRALIVAEFRARAQRAEVAKEIAGALRAAGGR